MKEPSIFKRERKDFIKKEYAHLQISSKQRRKREKTPNGKWKWASATKTNITVVPEGCSYKTILFTANFSTGSRGLRNNASTKGCLIEKNTFHSPAQEMHFCPSPKQRRKTIASEFKVWTFKKPKETSTFDQRDTKTALSTEEKNSCVLWFVTTFIGAKFNKRGRYANLSHIT